MNIIDTCIQFYSNTFFGMLFDNECPRQWKMGRFTENSRKQISKVNIRSSGNTRFIYLGTTVKKIKITFTKKLRGH